MDNDFNATNGERQIPTASAAPHGLREHEVAHLSPKLRAKLAAEMDAGRKAVGRHEELKEQSTATIEAMNAHRDEGSKINPETLTARRIAEHEMAADRAGKQQSVNIQVTAAKELADQHENLHGRRTVPAHVQSRVEDGAADLAAQRVRQAEETGIHENSGIAGHPAASEAQAEAAMANHVKEVADRSQATNYNANDLYQGHTTNEDIGIKTANFDANGNVIHTADDGTVTKYDANGNVIEDDDEELETQENGQARQTSEPSAHEVVMGTEDETAAPKRGRGRPKKSESADQQSADGRGPTSE